MKLNKPKVGDKVAIFYRFPRIAGDGMTLESYKPEPPSDMTIIGWTSHLIVAIENDLVFLEDDDESSKEYMAEEGEDFDCGDYPVYVPISRLTKDADGKGWSFDAVAIISDDKAYQRSIVEQMLPGCEYNGHEFAKLLSNVQERGGK